MHNLLSRQPSCLFFLQLFDPPLKHENTNLSYIVLFHSLTTHPAPSAQKVATGIILSELSVVVIAMMVICGTSAFVLFFFIFFSFPLFILDNTARPHLTFIGALHGFLGWSVDAGYPHHLYLVVVLFCQLASLVKVRRLHGPLGSVTRCTTHTTQHNYDTTDAI